MQEEDVRYPYEENRCQVCAPLLSHLLTFSPAIMKTFLCLSFMIYNINACFTGLGGFKNDAAYFKPGASGISSVLFKESSC